MTNPGDCAVPDRGPALLSYPGFVRLWFADAVSWIGTFSYQLALQLLLIQTLGADQAELGLVRGAQWLPMLLFGLLSGVLIDRVRRRPVLIGADSLAAVALGCIAALAIGGHLSTPILLPLVFLVGTATVFHTAAHQSFVPRLLPAHLLPRGYARLDQAMTAAETTGPLIAGTIIRLFSAPVAVAVNAVSHAISAVVIATVRVAEPAPASRDKDRPATRVRGRLWSEIKAGLGWVYRHQRLAPYAVGLHTWFVFHAAVMTVMVFHATVELGFSAVQLGAVLAIAGLSAVLAAGLAPRAADRFGLGRVCALAYWLTPAAFVFLLVAPPGTAGIVVIGCGQLVYGFSMGLNGPLELAYRNAVTPDALRARMNATIRSFNWGLLAISAPLAGLAAAAWGNRPVILIGILGLLLAACIVTFSPFRGASMADASPPFDSGGANRA